MRLKNIAETVLQSDQIILAMGQLKPMIAIGRNCLYPLKEVALFLFLLIFHSSVIAQNPSASGIIKGYVVNVNKEPLKGVSVSNKELKTKTFTDENGAFAIKGNQSNTVIVQLDGYITKTQSVTGDAEIEIVLNEEYNAENNQDIVNILYGKEKRNNISSAISQIYGSAVENMAILANDTKLAGVLPGLMVMQNNGEPGDESSDLWVRGKRTLRGKGPVILVDGIERDMNMLDPSDIATVTVLKDAASTAQYGMRGGNGIVLITTKRGEEGKIKVTFNARGGMKQPTTTPKFLDSYDYATLYNEAMYNDNPNQTPFFNSVDLAKYMEARNGTLSDLDANLYPDVDWYNKYLKKETWQQRYSLNIDGGNRFAKYFVSAGYTKNNGLYNVDKSVNKYSTNAAMNMLTLRSNLDISVTKRFTMSLDLSGKQEERTYPGSRTDAALRVFRALYKTPPNAHPILTPNGKIAGTKDYTSNPYGLLNYQGYSLYYTRNMFATLKLKHDLDFITSGLSVLGSVAFDSYYEQTTLRNKSFKVYQISTVLNADGTRTPQYNADGSVKYIETGSDTQMGGGGDYNDTRRTLNYEGALDYIRSFGKQ